MVLQKHFVKSVAKSEQTLERERSIMKPGITVMLIVAV